MLALTLMQQLSPQLVALTVTSLSGCAMWSPWELALLLLLLLLLLLMLLQLH
jgi:hypothetical protein